MFSTDKTHAWFWVWPGNSSVVQMLHAEQNKAVAPVSFQPSSHPVIHLSIQSAYCNMPPPTPTLYRESKEFPRFPWLTHTFASLSSTCLWCTLKGGTYFARHSEQSMKNRSPTTLFSVILLSFHSFLRPSPGSTSLCYCRAIRCLI